MFGVQRTMHEEGNRTVTYLESLTVNKFEVPKISEGKTLKHV